MKSISEKSGEMGTEEIASSRSVGNEVDRLKNDLISIVSHELRTPLAIVKSSVENLRAGVIGELTDKQMKVLDTTLRNIDRLGRIIHDFLDLSRLEAGVAKVHRRKADLDLILERVVNEFRVKAQARGVTFSSESSFKVPHVLADPGMMVTVFQKLFANAVQYAGTIAGVRAESEPEFVKVTVYDDGPGIPAEQRDKLFEKFTQLDRPDGGSGYKGTGLGLAICHEIIHLHQGEIWVECEKDKGTEVHILLPVYHDQDFFLRELEEFRRASDDGKTPFTLLTVAIHNYPEIKAQAVKRDIEWMQNDMVKTIDRMLRPGDCALAMDQQGVFYILLSGADRHQAYAVTERLHRVTKDCFCPGQTGRIFLDLSVGMAVYPNDTAELNELVRLSSEGAR